MERVIVAKDDLIAELEAEIEKLQWAITQWQAEEDDWVRDRATLEAEVARLNLVCDRLAAAGHS